MNSLKLSGHQSFSFRNTWLSKAIINLDKHPDLFQRDDALVILGVGKNMVDSMKYWCTGCQLISSQKNKGKFTDNISEIGGRLFLNHGRAPWDPYLEDIGTIWLVHYLYVTNQNYQTTAYFVFNHYSGSQFTRNELSYHLQSIAKKHNIKISANTISRDVNTFIHAYAGGVFEESNNDYEERMDCPLTELSLVSHNLGEDIFFIDRNPRLTLPDEIFLFATQNFINGLNQSTVSLNELLFSQLSPGRVFRMDESSLLEKLERFEILTQGNLILTETAGIRQLLIKGHVDPISHLQKYYE